MGIDMISSLVEILFSTSPPLVEAPPPWSHPSFLKLAKVVFPRSLSFCVFFLCEKGLQKFEISKKIVIVNWI